MSLAGPASRRIGTNLGFAAATLGLLLCCLTFSDLIPVGDGIGYDGRRYTLWVKHFSADRFLTGSPGGLVLDALDSYDARRILPMATVHYGLRVLGVPPSNANIIKAFRVANILLLTLAVYWLCCAADVIGMGVSGKALGFLALIVNYANLKMPLFQPILTDTFALALGTASLLLWLKRQAIGLLIVSLAGAITWPSMLHFAVLLNMFPRAESEVITRSPGRLNIWAACVSALACLGLIAFVFWTGHSIQATPVRPLASLVVPSALISAGFLFFGLRALLDSDAFWSSVHPLRVVRTPGFLIAAGLFVTVEAAVRAPAVREAFMTPQRFLMDTFYTAYTQPGIAYLAHVLFFGPLLLLAPYVWRPFCRSVQRQGTGLVLCFALALAIGIGSESRKLMNFYPFVVLFLSQALEGLPRTPRHWALLAILALVYSKVWLPMDRTLALPWIGEVEWQTLFASSRGPWIDHPWYAFQLVVTVAVALILYAVFARSRVRG